MLDFMSSSHGAAAAEPAADENMSGESDPANQPGEDSDITCSICLQAMEDRTVIPTCSHDFCFECLMIWTAQSRRCPLCTQTIGEYVIHDIRSRFDYRKHHLPPLRSNSPQPLLPLQTTAAIEARNSARRRRRDRQRDRQHREELGEHDKLELSIAKRRWIYKHDLYAKHVASNSFTKYRPYPAPAQFAASSDLISRTTTFLRRELQVWHGLDIEFLTNLIISLMKAIDIRSESAVKLLAEFLDMDIPTGSGQRRINAEHFAHEVYSYVRSPYRDLFVYDSVVQYDHPPEVSPPPQLNRSQNRWNRSPETRQDYPNNRRLRSRSRSPQRTAHRTYTLGDEEGQTRGSSSSASRSGLSSRPRSRTPVSPRPESPVARSRKIYPNKALSQRHDDPPPFGTRKGKEKENDLPHGKLRSKHEGDGAMSMQGDEPASPVIASDDVSLTSLDTSSSSREKPTEGFHSATPIIVDADANLSSPTASNVRNNTGKAGNRPLRQTSLSESVRAHLSLKQPAPASRPIRSQHHVSQHHMSSRPSSDSRQRRLSLLERLSDPVTPLTDGQQTIQQGATDHDHAFTGHHGGIALGSEIAQHLVSPNPPRDNETRCSARDPHFSSPTRSVNPTMIEPRPSSLNFGSSQDNCKFEPNKGAPGQTQTSLSVPSTPSPSAQAHMSARTRINSAGGEKEAHQRHVGSAPPTRGPQNPAPITLHQDQNSSKSQSDLRAKLLTRLEEEKKQACEVRIPQSTSAPVREGQARQCGSVNVEAVPTSELDRNSPKGDTGADRSLRRSMWDCRDPADALTGDSTPADALADGHARELSLRARMRARAKVEAEKRLRKPE